MKIFCLEIQPTACEWCPSDSLERFVLACLPFSVAFIFQW